MVNSAINNALEANEMVNDNLIEMSEEIKNVKPEHI